MRKRLLVFLCMSMTAATIFTGCSTSKSAPESTTEEAKPKIISTKELLSASDYDIDDYVTLPDDVMELQISLSKSYTPTDAGAQEYIKNAISTYKNYTKTEKTIVENGDVVNIDYVGKINNKEFDGGSATGTELKIGSNSFIEGFEKQLIGKKVGTTVTVNVTFPKDYDSKEVAGKPAVFTVKLNSIDKESQMTFDALTDDYVKKNLSNTYNVETKAALKEVLEDEYKNSLEDEKNNDIQNAVMKQLEERSKVTFPDGLLQKRVDAYISSVKNTAKSTGLSFDKYLSTYYSMDEAAFNKEVNSTVKSSLLDELILEAVVKKQEVRITEDDFNNFVDQYVTYYGYKSNDDFYKAYGGKKALRLSFAENQALSVVTKHATVLPTEQNK